MPRRKYRFFGHPNLKYGNYRDNTPLYGGCVFSGKFPDKNRTSVLTSTPLATRISIQTINPGIATATAQV